MKTTENLESISNDVELGVDDLRELKILMMADSGGMHEVRYGSMYTNVVKYQGLATSLHLLDGFT